MFSPSWDIGCPITVMDAVMENTQFQKNHTRSQKRETRWERDFGVSAPNLNGLCRLGIDTPCGKRGPSKTIFVVHLMQLELLQFLAHLIHASQTDWRACLEYPYALFAQSSADVTF